MKSRITASVDLLTALLLALLFASLTLPALAEAEPEAKAVDFSLPQWFEGHELEGDALRATAAHLLNNTSAKLNEIAAALTKAAAEFTEAAAGLTPAPAPETTPAEPEAAALTLGEWFAGLKASPASNPDESALRNVLAYLLQDQPFRTGVTITFLSLPQLVWLTLILGGYFALHFAFRRRSHAAREKLLRGMVYILMTCYFADFFLQDLYVDMSPEKLPFHACIFTAAVMFIAQFNHNGHKIMEAVVPMAVLSSMMYMCFPMSVGDSEPWSYRSVQTMLFHGAEMVWGLLALSLGLVKLNIRHVWKPGLMLLINILWAKVGNLLYDRNFFFLEEDALYIGLVEQGVLPRWSLMPINFAVYFLAILALYGVCHAIYRRMDKKSLPADETALAA